MVVHFLLEAIAIATANEIAEAGGTSACIYAQAISEGRSLSEDPSDGTGER